MPTKLFAIDPDGRLPIDRAKVQQDVLTAPTPCQFESAVILQTLLFRHRLHHAREHGLDGKRHEDLPVPLCRRRRAFVRDGVVPKPVEILPCVTHQLGARIFRQSIRGRNILGPARHQRPGNGLPLAGENGETGEGQRREKIILLIIFFTGVNWSETASFLRLLKRHRPDESGRQ